MTQPNKFFKSFILTMFSLACTIQGKTQNKEPIITDLSSSRSIYFSWISHAWEGTNEKQTLANLHFFKWLHDEYNMLLDIYLLDAGTLDEGPDCIGKLFGEGPYGSLESKRFKGKFPNGLKPITDLAKSFNCSLGMWLGPDGYGTSAEAVKSRSEMIISLCRDYGFKLFKFDRCCSDLSIQNQQYFINTIDECRKYVPDLIVLNHRISFNEEAKKRTTTWLWEGKETYVDVHYPSDITSTHHRAGVLSRGLVPQLKRLTEDHGVCISSCLDYWEDDLILQAFNRNLILAPEIYGSPWFLRDDEFPKLARIYNLHKQYNDILINGLVLPSGRYGESAVSRGNEHTRLITLRNVNWNTKIIKLKLDGGIGLNTQSNVEVRQYHPVEKILGIFKTGDEIDIEVLPFRSCLIRVTDQYKTEIGITGCDYETIKDSESKPIEIDLLGKPGENKTISLSTEHKKYAQATIDGKPANDLLLNKTVNVKFQGTEFKDAYHHKLADAKMTSLPAEAEALYEAICFAADNNALEVRSLLRSGPTKIPVVQKARDAFFNLDVFIEKGIWDKNLFDNDTSTYFRISKTFIDQPNKVLRLDIGKSIHVDSLIFRNVKGTLPHEVEVSSDLRSWSKIKCNPKGTDFILQTQQPFSYLRINNSLMAVSEIEGFDNGHPVDRTLWRASNLFSSYASIGFSKALKASFRLNAISKNSYLAIAIPGVYEPESVYAALTIDSQYIGAPDRSVSYQCNPWEANVFNETKGNYTYYIPLNDSMLNKPIDVYILANESKTKSLKAEVWITSYPIPFERMKLVLTK